MSSEGSSRTGGVSTLRLDAPAPRHREEEPAGTLPCEPGAVEARPVVPPPGRTLLGRYTVLSQLGQGSMGVVLSVYDARLDRRVALKLMRAWSRGRPCGDEEHARFLREAQAMARLNHPNVVGVYDAGTLEDGTLFIAMEHVQGRTLREWQKQRPWREVLDQYLSAGQGVAAAHAAGLTHHDFKPDNVLVGEDGRARVTDFGLARLEPGPRPTESPTSEVPPQQVASEEVLALTSPSGPWMGTPAYMAEEQFQGQRGDSRSDLYAFCVALFEALYGRVPFTGATVAELREAKRAGKAALPQNTPVPAWVGRAVLRGLHADPARRPSSMGELLAALEDDPEARRRGRVRRAAAASLTVMLGLLAAWGWAGHRQQRCERMEQRLAGVWDEAIKARVEHALVATGVPYAQATAERVEGGLDAYAGAWVRQRTEVCLGTSREGSTQAAGLLLLEETCLERRRSQLRALTELLTEPPDAELVSNAVQAVQALPPLEYCADAKALTAAVPPPEDPAVRAKVEALQEQVDRQEALLEAGKYKEGLGSAEALVSQAEPVGYAPLLARTQFVSARLREEAGDYAGAEARLEQTMASAARGKDTALLARTWSAWLMLVGVRQKRPQEALQVRPVVEHLVELADDDPIRAAMFSSLGAVLRGMGRYEEARQAHLRALALREKVLGPEHPLVATSLNNLGLVLENLGQYEEARKAHLRALELRQKVLGPEHPAVASSLNNLGIVLGGMGRYEEAREIDTRVLELRRKVLGPEHPDVASSLNNLGNDLTSLGRYEEAREAHSRALALRQKVLGPEHPSVADSLDNQGLILRHLGRYEEARQAHLRGLELRQKVLGSEHPSVAISLNNLGLVLQDMGRFEEALVAQERALAMRRKLLGPEHPGVAISLNNLGLVLQDMGRFEEARVAQERALALRQKALGPEHPLVSTSLSCLGDALRGLGRVAQAREQYTRAMALQDKVLPPDSEDRLWPLLGMGQLWLAEGSAAEAVPLLERALKLAPAHGRAQIQFPLAQALWETRADRKRAVELATQARDEWSLAGRQSDAKQISQWLKEHAGSQP